jgi:hypothetical protein
MPNSLSPVTGEAFYSGTIDDIKNLLGSIDIGEGKLAQGFGEENIAYYQEMVDRDIDSILEPLYWVPLVAMNQKQPDGTEKLILPGRAVKAARYWVSGLILKTEYQELSQNTTDQAEQYITQAKQDVFSIVRFNLRLYGQRRKSNLSRTLPPGMQPPAIPEANF